MRGLAGFLVAAVLGVLSFPPIGLWPLAYVALVPFLNAAIRRPPRQALRAGYIGGLVFYGGLLYWIGLNSGAPAALAWASAAAVAAILASVWAITAWGAAHAAQRAGRGWAALLFVALYAFQEVFWGSGELGFPWAIWGLTQTGFLPAAQLADLGDVWLVSLWVLSLNALLFLLWKREASRRRTAVAALAVLIAPPIYGWVRMNTLSIGEPVAVAAVQGNSDVEAKWQRTADEILATYLDLSHSLQGLNRDVVVWPETAVPVPLRFRAETRAAMQRLADSLNSAVLAGATDYAGTHGGAMLPYNSAFYIRPRTPQLYSSAKLHLVPFGERIPGQKLMPFLGRIRLGQAEFMPGDSAVVFPHWENAPALGSLICFEVVFPEIAADYARGGAELLANITEDGWYGNSSGPYQHLALTQLRAIAVRRSIIRAANTGISALIQPTGRIMAALAYHRRGVVTGELPRSREITPAARLARIWPAFYAVLAAAAAVVVMVQGRRGRTAPTNV